MVGYARRTWCNDWGEVIMDSDGKAILIGGCLLGIVIGLLFGFIIYEIVDGNQVEELGGSICGEEYNMSFESYSNKVLKCKPRVLEYDGISVEV